MKQLSFDLQMTQVSYLGNPHKPGDVVFILFDPQYDERYGSKAFPYIGSANEIDCKVIEAYEGGALRVNQRTGVPEQVNEMFYNIITGRGNKFDHIPHRILVPAKEREKYRAARLYTLMEDTEIAPAGTEFAEIGEFIQNEFLGIYIHTSRFAECEKYFKHLQ